LIIILVAGGLYSVLPRPIAWGNSSSTSSSTSPTYVRLFGRTFELVGTTGKYYNRTISTFQDLITHPLGTGPANATIDPSSFYFEQIYHFSFVSNIFVFGATYGWLNMLFWILLLLFVYRSVFILIKKPGLDQKEVNLTLILLAILIASILPGSSIIGPFLNWSRFDIARPVSITTTGLPAEYIALISGLVVGLLLGLLYKLRRNGLIPKYIEPIRNIVLEKGDRTY
jgi:hypothetical protein